MAGSESFKRYQSFQAPPETQAAQEPVHIAITYDADGLITGYRNGLPYGKAYKSNGPKLRLENHKLCLVFVIPLQEVTGCSLGLFLVQDCTTER